MDATEKGEQTSASRMQEERSSGTTDRQETRRGSRDYERCVDIIGTGDPERVATLALPCIRAALTSLANSGSGPDANTGRAQKPSSS